MQSDLFAAACVAAVHLWACARDGKSSIFIVFKLPGLGAAFDLTPMSLHTFHKTMVCVFESALVDTASDIP